MVLSCRHCYSPDEMLPRSIKDKGSPHQKEAQAGTDAAASAAPSYMGLFVYGNHERLLKTMEWVESQQPMPSITVWCERCRKVSIVSYKLYRHLCIEEDGMREAEVLGMHEYYSRMCISAERLIQFQFTTQQQEVDFF